MRIILISILILMYSCQAPDSKVSNADSGLQVIPKNAPKPFSVDQLGQDLKDKVLCDCIASSVEPGVSSKDVSYAGPIYRALSFDSLSRNILKPVMLRIKADSIESINTVAESSAGSKIGWTCLTFYKSSTLDSIVKQHVKQWSKIRDMDSLIRKNVADY